VQFDGASTEVLMVGCLDGDGEDDECGAVVDQTLGAQGRHK
jgi:hypothetical protein